MAKPTAQQCHALTTYFVSGYTDKFSKKPVVSRNKARWQWEGILMDFTPVEARELVDYYFDKYENNTLEWFLYNYEKVAESKSNFEENRKRATKIMSETQRRAEEWRKRWQSQKQE